MGAEARVSREVQVEKTALGLIAALGAAATVGSAQAAVPPMDGQGALHASSVGELLDPIPNALEVMKATQSPSRRRV